MTFANTLIKASAGSGKTFQLSNRYLQLIFRGTAPETILATTFTRKAAGEILDRILERLAKAATDEAKRHDLSKFVLTGNRQGEILSREEVLATLARLVRNIHRLRVSTLDSFFQQIAASMGLDLGMPTGWLIMEEDDRSPLLLEGIRTLLEQLGKDRTVELMYLLFKGESRSTVTREINALLSDLAAVYDESSPDAWRQLQRAREMAEGEIKRLVFDLAQAEIAVTQKREPNKSMLKARNDDLATIRDALDAGRPVPWESLGGRGLCAKAFDGSYKYGRADMPDSLCRVYDAIAQQVRATVINRLAVQTEAMDDLLGELTVIVDALKNQRRRFDFSDITNRLARASLDGKFGQITHRIDANTQHLLLDEFQDTSPNQWLVLRPFAKRITGSAANKDNATHADHESNALPEPSFFCVGDVKQAIYGWRGGVAAIFDAIETDLGSLTHESLDKSYRSSKPVIDAVNEVFGNLGSNAALHDDGSDPKKAADVAPLTEAAERWARRFELHETERTELPGFCSMRTSMLPEEKFDENGEPVKPTAEDREQAHLRYVIDEIVRRHRQSPTATIGVLTRTNRMVQRIIFGLRSEGIEASEEGGNTLDQSPAVELILSALSLADYPGNRVACYHLAHSPLGAALGVTPGNCRDEKAMQTAALRIRDRLMIEGYSAVLHDWVAQIATSCDERDLGRMIQLLEMAAAYQRKAKIRTTPLINLVRAKAVESPSASPIRVMSIHKSKGLQFDIVVLPELEAKLSGSRTPKVVAGRKDPTSQFSAVLAYPAKAVRQYLPERFQTITAQNETERVEETLCVLYVAMTRAVHELLMILQPKAESTAAKKGDNVNDGDESSKKGVKFARTMAGVLHAQLASTESLAVEDAELYCNDKGRRDWAVLQFGHVSGETTQDAPAVSPAEHRVTIQLAQTPKNPAKNLTRMTPSGQEGTGGGDSTNDIYTETTDAAREFGYRWGTAMHACFEQVAWLEEGLPDREKLLKLVSSIMPDAVSAGQVVDAFYASCEKLETRTVLSLDAYRRPRETVESFDLQSAVHGADSPALRRVVQNERRFSVSPRPDVLLQGSFDRLVLLYDDSGPKPRVVGADVIDFKSDVIENDEKLDARVEYYAPQLAEYRKAVAAMYRLKNDWITTRLLFTAPGKVVAVQ